MRDAGKAGALVLLVIGFVILLGGAGCALVGASWMAGPDYAYSPFDADAGRDLLATGLVQAAIGAGLMAAGIGVRNQTAWRGWLGPIAAVAFLAAMLVVMVIGRD